MNVPSIGYKHHRFSASIIAHAVWLYVEELLLERGIRVSYETIRQWARKFGSEQARRIRRKPASSQDIRHLDEPSSVSMVKDTSSGVPSIRMDMSSMKSFKIRRNTLQYVFGNVLIATQMTQYQLPAGLYAPLRVMLYENTSAPPHSNTIDRRTFSASWAMRGLDQQIYNALITGKTQPSQPN